MTDGEVVARLEGERPCRALVSIGVSNVRKGVRGLRRARHKLRGVECSVDRLLRVFLFVATLVSAATESRAQLSPGPLAHAHEALDGPAQCFNCHGKGESSLGERCLACHKEIAWLVEKGLGLHAREAKKECARCHPDHAGRDFAMIHFEEGAPERFDHRRSGWPLEGKHAELSCRQCHKPEFQVFGVARLSQKGKKSTGWLGLDRTCASCHKDAHRGALGRDCARCHGNRAWKPAARFDHAKASYPLTGKHAQVACEKCHTAAALDLPTDEAGKRIPRYKPLPHAECGDCHADPHEGRLGPACSKCHATDSFLRVDQKGFDHDRTRYPLRGGHVRLACAQCHDPRAAWGKKPPFSTCGGCHRDPHAGAATLAGKGADCQACHRVDAFRPSSFTVAQHRLSRYPLTGRHAEIKCEACHPKNPSGVPPERLGKAGVLLRRAHNHCKDCHEDAHGGQLARRPDKGACEGCHRVEGWKPTAFTVKEHAALRLPLHGRHANIACAACHGAARKGLPPLRSPEKLGSAKVALVLGETACVACHLDPHEGRFEPDGARPQKSGCVGCHRMDAFRPSAVDVTLHGKFSFPLEGGHRAASCERCHGELKAEGAKSTLLLAGARSAPLLFSVKEQRCEACHVSPHGDQFSERRDHGACETCHAGDAFRPASRFNHDRDARFPLEGAHVRVPCGRCHVSRAEAQGRTRVIYRPTASTCKSCHGEQAMKPLARREPFPEHVETGS